MTAAQFAPLIDPASLERDQLRDLAAEVIRSGFGEFAHARTLARAIAEARTCTLKTRKQYVISARAVLHDLEGDRDFYRGPALEEWASVLDLDGATVEAIRERYEAEAAPIRRALRMGLERVGVNIQKRG